MCVCVCVCVYTCMYIHLEAIQLEVVSQAQFLGFILGGAGVMMEHRIFHYPDHFLSLLGSIAGHQALGIYLSLLSLGWYSK